MSPKTFSSISMEAVSEEESALRSTAGRALSQFEMVAASMPSSWGARTRAVVRLFAATSGRAWETAAATRRKWTSASTGSWAASFSKSS